jgi:hypothetical protein
MGCQLVGEAGPAPVVKRPICLLTFTPSSLVTYGPAGFGLTLMLVPNLRLPMRSPAAHRHPSSRFALVAVPTNRLRLHFRPASTATAFIRGSLFSWTARPYAALITRRGMVQLRGILP